MMEPVIVCVVLTGIDNFSARNRVSAPAVSAATPSSGGDLGDTGTHCFYDLPAPAHGAERYTGEAADGHPHIIGYKGIEGEMPSLCFFVIDDGRADDTHYFLRVITSMPRLSRPTTQLQPSKPAVRLIRVGPLAYIHNKYGEKEAMIIPISGAAKINRKVGTTLA